MRRARSRRLGGVALLVALAAVTVVLGFWGASQIPGADHSASDKLYITVQLFYANLSIPEASTPWQLDVARFLAPIVVGYALLLAAFALARDQAQRLRVSLLARGHVLIVGAGERGAALARSLRGARRVVVVDRDPLAGPASSLRETGIPVLAGDGRDPEILRAARARRAGQVVVLAGSDSTNLEVLAALKAVTRGDAPVPIHVAIDAPAVWSALHRWPLQRSGTRRVEFMSLPDREARLLVDSAAADAKIARDAPRLLIRGHGPVAARLCVHLLRSPLAGDGVDLMLEGEDAEENLAILSATDPWVFDRAVVRVPGQDEGLEAAAAFVCGLEGADALDAAMRLLGRVESGATIHVAVPDADLGDALRGAGIELTGVKLVPTAGALLGEELLEGSAVERLARARHAEYLAEQLQDGALPDRPALRPWDELDERYRQANRRFVDGVAEVLGKLDAELVPLTGRDAGPLPIGPEALEELAIAEHERWYRDQLADGWRPTDGDRDDERKLHPMLRPWQELPESEREKDRDAIRSLPNLFAGIGYELILANQPERGLRG